MKRSPLTVCLFIVLGAIVNIAVAWGIAVALGSQRDVGSRLVLPPYDEHRAWSAFSDSERDLFQSAGWVQQTNDGDTWAQVFRHDFVGWRETIYHARYQVIIPPHAGHREAVAYGFTNLPIIADVFSGWPRESMRASHHLSPTGATHFNSVKLPALIGLLPDTTGYFVPIGMVWPGFAINTVFYAAILWAVFAASFALRRRRRIRRGLCPKCAYDLRGSASKTCPECGAAVS